MIFGLVKMIVWVAGVVTVSYFALPYLGYEINLHYWSERKVACQEKLEQCQRDLNKGGIEGAREKCSIACVDSKLLIRKIEKE